VAARAEVLQPEGESREAFIQECKLGRFNGVVALYRAAITVAGKFDAEMVAALPASLKFICYTGMSQIISKRTEFLLAEVDPDDRIADWI
jgi:glyoxylate reductase